MLAIRLNLPQVRSIPPIPVSSEALQSLQVPLQRDCLGHFWDLVSYALQNSVRSDGGG